VIITSNEQSMGDLGADVPLEVFSGQEALAFLRQRTGNADPEGARMVAAELGYLPLALAQAAAVIAGQRRGYGEYLERLRALSFPGKLPCCGRPCCPHRYEVWPRSSGRPRASVPKSSGER
jgi:hypothetical protein